jgi:hypothetical protein
VSAIDGDNAVVNVMIFGELRSVTVPLEQLGPRED